MSIVDVVILAILGLSILIGMYRGFIASVASMGGCLLSLLLSFLISPAIASAIQKNPNLLKSLVSYSDAATRIGDQVLARTPVANLTQNAMTEVITRVSLPAPLTTLLQSNMTNKVFGAAVDVGTYISQTIIGAILNVICFIVCFAVLMLVIHLVINFLKVVFKFPVLKQLNSFAGACFGLLRGVLLCFVAFALLPLFQTLLPIQNINELVQRSALAPLFNSGNLILAIMRGRLF